MALVVLLGVYIPEPINELIRGAVSFLGSY
jgi:hypothetical protein